MPNTIDNTFHQFTEGKITALSAMETHDLIVDEIEADYFAGDFTRFIEFLIDKGTYPDSMRITREQAFKSYCEHKKIVRTGLAPY